ncbi:hypothetical protein [Desulfomonile tiedjei]|uniref:Uncharacterized protein n=1 Tax=Desulfomonile tiedjei (strain ATCC 49306 / DSM 6799 / DCB-1) TaxID=706587 RepID=I4CC83_DESTA|nr:hypothetical protein [Desulfomonile tiedjei]AFM27174.1 hypothetical protein Desti_4546 [Desulfomonile tiedjei DSM 6799]
MERIVSLEEMRKSVETLTAIARQLYEASEDFPAVNRNSKRVLASLEMLRINIEEA